jgi:hypothetical protein
MRLCLESTAKGGSSPLSILLRGSANDEAVTESVLYARLPHVLTQIG